MTRLGRTRRARSCAGRACTPVTSWTGGDPGDAGALAGPARPRGLRAADLRDAQSARLRKEKAQLERELAKARSAVDVRAKLQALLGWVARGISAPGPHRSVLDVVSRHTAPVILSARNRAVMPSGRTAGGTGS